MSKEIGLGSVRIAAEEAQETMKNKELWRAIE